MSKALTTRQQALSKAAQIVPYLTPEEVARLAAATGNGKRGERDRLLIRTLFETGLRISEALQLTPRHISQYEGRPVIHLKGKGRKPRMVAIPQNLVDKMMSYAYQRGLDRDSKFFKINRSQAWRILQSAAERAGINKKVYPHLLRHSDAIERLRQTGNPRALQLHLGHSSQVMTMRYLNTLTVEDALRIQQEVEF